MTAHPSARADVLVVGGGPAGLATATSLARHGHRVVVVDRTTNDDGLARLLNPRALHALDQLDIGRPDGHDVPAVRLSTSQDSITIDWPTHRSLPSSGLVTNQLGTTLRTAAEVASVHLLRGHTATSPIIERGFVRGARVNAPDGTTFETRADFTVVADGADSRFGRGLGTFREPTWPYGLMHQASFEADVHASAAVELVLDLRDRSGTPIIGHGWLHPAADGTATVGVALMSTSPSFQVINPANLFHRLVDDRRRLWGLADQPTGATRSTRLPLGLSVGPSAGPTYLLVGDAAGAANPLSRTGAEGALETARLASDVLHEAIDTGDAGQLQRYPKLLRDRFGSYYKMGRLMSRLLAQPSVARRAEHAVVGRRSVADAYLRLTTDSLRTGRNAGVVETAYRLGRAAAIVAPDA